MSVHFKHRSRDYLALVPFTAACGYGGYWMLTNNPNNDGLLWAGLLLTLAGLGSWGILRGWS